jgi:hypothetical protein
VLPVLAFSITKLQMNCGTAATSSPCGKPVKFMLAMDAHIARKASTDTQHRLHNHDSQLIKAVKANSNTTAGAYGWHTLAFKYMYRYGGRNAVKQSPFTL